MRYPKTEFGIELKVFCSKHGLTIESVAKNAGVNYATLLSCTTGRSPGYELIPKVKEYMATYEGRAGNA